MLDPAEALTPGCPSDGLLAQVAGPGADVQETDERDHVRADITGAKGMATDQGAMMGNNLAAHITALEKQMRDAAAATPYQDKPLVVITRTEPFGIPESSLGFSPDTLEQAWLAAQMDLIALTPDAHHLVADQSAHYVQITQPDVVIAAIRSVVDAVRDPGSWATPRLYGMLVAVGG